MRFGVKTSERDGPVDGCVKRNRKKLTVTQNQPRFTNNWLKMLLFLAKYDGASSDGCACSVALYGELRVEGSTRAKSEPRNRVMG